MGHSSVSTPFLLCVLVLPLFQIPADAAKQAYIVYMGEHSHGPNPTELDVEKATRSHIDFLKTFLQSDDDKTVQSRMIYSYTQSINGFAAVLDEEQVAAIRRHPSVVSVLPNKEIELLTTRSWEFMGLGRDIISYDSIWKKAKYGRGVIIANLDTGVWPENPSFSDQGLGPVPPRWRGSCQPKSGVTCNRKLIGAKSFFKGFAAAIGPLNDTSARDYDGHGSHTLSTAGGSFVPGADFLGIAKGTAEGGSPKARVASYKVCRHWCFEADVVAGFDEAIGDGVDVINLSLGADEPEPNYLDVISIGAFHAIKKGIIVAAAAGNSGPIPRSIGNEAPWYITVGASTLDRKYATYLTLGNKKVLKGFGHTNVTLPSGKFYPLISGEDAKAPNASHSAAKRCSHGSLDPKSVAGKIVFCIGRGGGFPYRVEIGYHLMHVGAAGMVISYNPEPDDESSLYMDAHFLPAVVIIYTDEEAVSNYIRSTENPVAYISPARTIVGKTVLAPQVADFSSRGPCLTEPAMLKPDVTAPGMGVLAAYTEEKSATGLDFDKRKVPYMLLKGTSMAAPHVAGIAGLLRAMYPDWSPAAIKSAIMTTATTRANDEKPIIEYASGGKHATPFGYGAGHVQPNLAADPGLVYDLIINDYLNFLCAHGSNASVIAGFAGTPYACPKNFTLFDFNYPSIAIPNLQGPVTATRRLKNVGTPGTYKVQVNAPSTVSVAVEPESLTFREVGEEQAFKITFKPGGTGSVPQGYVFGELVWTDEKHSVKSPIAVKFKVA